MARTPLQPAPAPLIQRPNTFEELNQKTFVSAMRPDVSSSGYPSVRPYTSTRGIIINKEFVDGVTNPDLSKGYIFQFNPNSVSDSKETIYEARPYAGLPYNDYIWGGGGERVISFQLFLDNTPQSKQYYFRPTEYGSREANSPMNVLDAGSGDNSDRRKYELYGTSKSVYADGRESVNNVNIYDERTRKILKNDAMPVKDYPDFRIQGRAYSSTRVHARGILPEVELLQSFLYPAPLANESTPLFAEGGVVNTEQFRPPAIAILALGPIYLEGVIKSAPVNYTLFDSDLTPLRGTVDIEFAAFEFANLERQIERK